MEVRKITKQEVNDLPLIKYEGESIIINHPDDVKEAAEYLSQYDLLGFDTETKPAFKKGQVHPVALLQLATPDKVYLIRLLQTGLPQEIIDIFENPNITIAGIGIRDDIKDLKKIKEFKPRGFVDLNEKARQLGFESIGARNFAGMFMDGRISKGQQVSNWENETLTDAQISYAATDAWICIDVFEQMDELEDK
ncbi:MULTISPECIES: 3'-5' exonuclease [Reichenbachiella]|uniref:3'-5' exonuclease n=1 Tax=Reichenbachiella agariperforans TaxID=156994 RepID=A0A1M6KZ43_REIAG|nr:MULTISPECIES: 3'-5' exonuclease [Reichenbachiella]MBU2913729.1 3'-5' exonuclease domain-containing protein 2 [Reichenbachiella agariperforans]RJE74336.1 3'-5' exonuclease [Reichenbachiella sp. MSK19-1]SHJ64218.1 3'-5' exonuclease [Reichenbachiella agariperforans]